jgi:hypothetical protein
VSLPRLAHCGGDGAADADQANHRLALRLPPDESLQERPEFGELRSHIRELVMSEYRAQQALLRPASLSE